MEKAAPSQACACLAGWCAGRWGRPQTDPHRASNWSWNSWWAGTRPPHTGRSDPLTPAAAQHHEKLLINPSQHQYTYIYAVWVPAHCSRHVNIVCSLKCTCTHLRNVMLLWIQGQDKWSSHWTAGQVWVCSAPGESGSGCRGGGPLWPRRKTTWAINKDSKLLAKYSSWYEPRVGACSVFPDYREAAMIDALSPP